MGLNVAGQAPKHSLSTPMVLLDRMSVEIRTRFNLFEKLEIGSIIDKVMGYEVLTVIIASVCVI